MVSKQGLKRASAPGSSRTGIEGDRPEVSAPFHMWPGQPWMTPWMTPWVEFWANYWTTLLGQGLAAPQSVSQRRGEGTDRRHGEGLPWLPKVETSVIPLSRRTDPPGQQADKISMRVQVPNLPWIGGGNVIAFDAVVPRSDREDPPSDASGAAPGSKSDWR